MSLRHRALGLAAAGAATLALAPVAQACDIPAAPVFAPWGDDALYQPVVDGGFESGAAAWTLTGGASVVRDQDDGIPLDGAADDHALHLGPGATATSPPICVTKSSVSYRFLSNAVVAGTGTRNLRVEVVYLGKKAKAEDLAVPLGGSSPTSTLKLSSGQFSTQTTVRLRISTLGGATVNVDDVYMDPRMH